MVYWQEALSGSMEVAIAIAGFSGIVAVFGRRSDGLLRTVDQLRLHVLLTASAIALLLSIAPFIVLDTGVSESLFWRVGSGIQGTWIVSISTYRFQQARVAGVSSVMSMRVLAPMVLIVFLAQVANAAFYGLSWMYVIGVVFQLFVAFIAFSSLLLDRWRDEED
jgi:hypothetical protein